MAAEGSASTHRRQTFLIFGMCSLLAIAVGLAAANTIGVGRQALLLNIVVWVIGAALVASLSRVPSRLAFAWLALAAALLLLTLFSTGLSHVHRWFSIGPVRMNAAELMLPAAIVVWRA
jgi:cell division protein FtsW (lipid II flippase)